MEAEENCLKCLPLVSRLGKKLLFILAAVNVVIIWFIYKNSDYISNFGSNSNPVNENSPLLPLYEVPIYHIPLLLSKDMSPYYSEVTPDIWCFQEGTDLKESKQRKKCICFPQWFGLDCGIPSSLWKSNFLLEGKNAGVEIRRRDKPRRIIHSIAFDDNLDLLDINIRNLFTTVDVILVAEENNNSESALSMFKNGYLSEFQNKVMPVSLNKSVLHEEHDWVTLMLKELWIIGWNRLSDFRPDDIFLFSHVSSILSRDVLLFLKLYDGYPEPFYFNLRPLLFKFSKVLKNSNRNQTLVPFKPSGCTFQFLSTMCEYSVSKFLETKCMGRKSRRQFFEKENWPVKEWIVGSDSFPSGWHCNFCCKSDCMFNIIKRRKWDLKTSASVSLNFKTVNASVIEQIFKLHSFTGYNITYEKVPKSDLYFAPKVVLDSKKYKYLLE